MENYSKDIQEVADITEKVLQCLIYRLLEKFIIKESAEGYIQYSSIPQGLLEDLKTEEAKIVNLETENKLDNMCLRKLMDVVEVQAEYTMNKHHQSFHQLVVQLNLEKDTEIAYDTYVKVAKNMFTADLTWHHLISLLCFGIEVSLHVIREGWQKVRELLKQIAHFTIGFIIKERIADWITRHGGFMAMIKYFDGECSNHAHHILSIMTFCELTNCESLLRGITAIAVVSGVLVTVYQILKHR